MDPAWGGRPPAWSPDGKYLAYVQGGPLKLIYYAGQKLAVVPVSGGPERVVTPALDRNVLSPTWSSDGTRILFLLEEDRVMQLASVAAGGGSVQLLTRGRRMVGDYSIGRNEKVALLTSTPGAPSEGFRFGGWGAQAAVPSER